MKYKYVFCSYAKFLSEKRKIYFIYFNNEAYISKKFLKTPT